MKDTILSCWLWSAEDGSPKPGNRIELEAMYEQVHYKQQTAQMATLTAHKDRERWQHEGGPPPLHSHYGQVRCSLGPLPLPAVSFTIWKG